MIYYYLDTSAWLKRYYEEAGTDQVRELFGTDVAHACATLGYIEMIATSARKHKAGQLASDLFRERVQSIERDWSHFVQIALSPLVLAQAKVSAHTLALRGADAIHLASALVFQEDLVEPEDRMILVTSDQELKTAAEASGIEVLDPTDQPPPALTPPAKAQPSDESEI